jgi:DNA-binding NarL/FixJ family response regulator
VPLRVGVADDHLLVREAICSVLDGVPTFALAAVCAEANALRAAVDEQALDVVVADIRMGPTWSDDGIRLAVELRQTRPHVGVVVLSAYCEPAYALALLAAGSNGRAYLLKDRLHDRAQLVTTIDAVARGGSVVDPKVVEALVRSETRPAHPALETLSPREQQILAQMAAGASNAGIAESLGLTKHAVEKHVNAVFAKLDLPVTPEVSRRVRAVLMFLAEASGRAAGAGSTSLG